eukprot:PhF_6_TR13020/c0_g1_i1/m.20637
MKDVLELRHKCLASPRVPWTLASPTFSNVSSSTHALATSKECNSNTLKQKLTSTPRSSWCTTLRGRSVPGRTLSRMLQWQSYTQVKLQSVCHPRQSNGWVVLVLSRTSQWRSFTVIPRLVLFMRVQATSNFIPLQSLSRRSMVKRRNKIKKSKKTNISKKKGKAKGSLNN